MVEMLVAPMEFLLVDQSVAKMVGAKADKWVKYLVGVLVAL